MDKIMPNRLDRGFYMYQQEFEEKALEVLRSGWYVLGREVEQFEQEFVSQLQSSDAKAAQKALIFFGA